MSRGQISILSGKAVLKTLDPVLKSQAPTSTLMSACFHVQKDSTEYVNETCSSGYSSVFALFIYLSGETWICVTALRELLKAKFAIFFYTKGVEH